jgi:mannose-6-phosphate isomerase-like protein (cupin superfamily)
MLLPVLVLLAALGPSRAESREVWKSGEIDTMLAGTRGELPLVVRENYAILLRVRTGRAGAPENHSGADEIVQVRKGRATIIVDGRPHEVGPGDLLHIPRNTVHQMDPLGGRLEVVAVRIFPTGEDLPPRSGFLAPRRMPDVLKKAEIDAVIENHNRNQPLHGTNAYTMNYVIYPGRPGPWEAHRGCVDVYFLQRGTATVYLGGEIVKGREIWPGEIRGDGVRGAREYEIGPGDLVQIPRGGAHHVAPGGNKLGYLLLKIWAE